MATEDSSNKDRPVAAGAIAYTQDTIAALATAPGRGGIGVIRCSGPRARTVARGLLRRDLQPRYAHYLPFVGRDGQVIDHGIALLFPAPHSYTGEDVLELQGHGGPVVMDLLLQEILGLGTRAARPGEFSERAFLNGKIDLAQAEAIADLIEAGSAEAARSALRSLEGEFSRRIHTLVEGLTELRVYCEAAIDFPEEEIDFLTGGKVRERVEALQAGLRAITAAARQGSLLREGMQVVIAGRPNAGKSSLLNRLARRESAIVSDIPGTTRDVLREQIQIDGMPVHVIDTAGLRRSADPIERLGIDRALGEIERADRLLLLIDASDPASHDIIAELAVRPEIHRKLTIIRNKIDLTGERPDTTTDAKGMTEIRLSARSGDGLHLLQAHLAAVMGLRSAGEGSLMARRRHLDALARAERLIVNGLEALTRDGAGELLAEDLRQAQQVLGEITGEVTSDDLLGQIFTSFCIGK